VALRRRHHHHQVTEEDLQLATVAWRKNMRHSLIPFFAGRNGIKLRRTLNL
jgi:hypothetical protein